MGTGLPGGTRLWGRDRECMLLDELVSSVRRGESRSLVLRGEAGIREVTGCSHRCSGADGGDPGCLSRTGDSRRVPIGYPSRSG
jgi:hypothetical protein